MQNFLPHPDPAAAALVRGRTQTRVLPNGFTALVEPDHSAPVASVRVSVRPRANAAVAGSECGRRFGMAVRRGSGRYPALGVVSLVLPRGRSATARGSAGRKGATKASSKL